MKKAIVRILAVLIFVEAGILLLAYGVEGEQTMVYALAARYSARLSFLIIAALMLWTGITGLRQIYNNEKRWQVFVLAISAFAINHLIHFVFIVLNYRVNALYLLESKNIPGAFGYVAVSLAPLWLLSHRKLTRSLYAQLVAYFFVLAGIFVVTYRGRIKNPVPLASPVFLYQLCLTIMVLLIFVNIVRIVRDMWGEKQ